MDNSDDYKGLLQFADPTSRAMIKFARDPVVQGLTNAVVTNPVVSSVRQYVNRNTPLGIAGDIASTGAIAASMAYPPVAIPIGLARIAGPRVASGLAAFGREYVENQLANQMANTAMDVGLLAEDSANIAKALRRR